MVPSTQYLMYFLQTHFIIPQLQSSGSIINNKKLPFLLRCSFSIIMLKNIYYFKNNFIKLQLLVFYWALIINLHNKQRIALICRALTTKLWKWNRTHSLLHTFIKTFFKHNNIAVKLYYTILHFIIYFSMFST